MTTALVTVETLQRVLGGEIVRSKDGHGRQVSCPGPGHSATDRSLTVKPANSEDGFIVTSFAGDDWQRCKEFVRTKLGLAAFRGHEHNAREIVASYDYVDEVGNLLFQVVRQHPKKFLQRRPDGKGGRNWK